MRRWTRTEWVSEDLDMWVIMESKEVPGDEQLNNIRQLLEKIVALKRTLDISPLIKVTIRRASDHSTEIVLFFY